MPKPSEIRVCPETAERTRLKATSHPELDARNEATFMCLATTAVQQEHHLQSKAETRDGMVASDQLAPLEIVTA